MKTSKNIEMVPVASVTLNALNIRGTHNKDITGLASDTDENGQTTPITARLLPDGSYRVLQGERRTLAARLNGWIEMPAYVIECSDDEEALLLVDSGNDRPLNSEGECLAAVIRLKDAGLNEKQITVRLSDMLSAISPLKGDALAKVDDAAELLDVAKAGDDASKIDKRQKEYEAALHASRRGLITPFYVMASAPVSLRAVFMAQNNGPDWYGDDLPALPSDARQLAKSQAVKVSRAFAKEVEGLDGEEKVEAEHLFSNALVVILTPSEKADTAKRLTPAQLGEALEGIESPALVHAVRMLCLEKYKASEVGHAVRLLMEIDLTVCDCGCLDEHTTAPAAESD